MNPFEITWLVATTNTNNTKKVLNKLFRAGIISISGCGTGYIAHYPNKEKAIEASKIVIEQLQGEGIEGNIYFITDKQFGMSIFHYGNNPMISATIKPFEHSIIFVRKGIVQQIPISQKQIEETIQF